MCMVGHEAAYLVMNLSVFMYNIAETRLVAYICLHLEPFSRNNSHMYDFIIKLRSSVVLKQPKYNTMKRGFISFRYQGAKIWIELPTVFKTVKYINGF